MTSRRIRPLHSRGRLAIVAIIFTSAALSVVQIALTVRVVSRNQNRAPVLEVAARQRTLAERYAKTVVLTRLHAPSDPWVLGRILIASANALLDGGRAPTVAGDDDEATLPRAQGRIVRAQLRQEQRLARDLVNTGNAWLSGRPVTGVALTAGEHPATRSPLGRLRILTALASNVSLNAARTIGQVTDDNTRAAIMAQIGLGVGGLLVSLALALALIRASRRQVAHFRSLVMASDDLVIACGPAGARYVGDALERLIGRPARDMSGWRFLDAVHPDDRAAVRRVCECAERRRIGFRILGREGVRHLEAHVTDLRQDRHVRCVVLNARDITERVHLEAELAHQAFHDSLTALANRALFHDHLTQALARTRRTQHSLAVLLVDLDGFKAVNDSLGHMVGDELLRAVAGRLSDQTRPTDTLARLGGDEFALLTEDVDEAGAAALACRLLGSLTGPIEVGQHSLRVGASIGIAVRPPGGSSAEDLMRGVDVAMYAAKALGRGRYEFYRDEMGDRAGELLTLQQDLRRGLEAGELEVHYQPEYDLTSGRMMGAEALARWTSPTRGAVSPGEFIPVAEASGLIGGLGELVLRVACGQAARWVSAGLVGDDFTVWVNVSGAQLAQGGVHGLVRVVLDEHGLAPGRLGLEVTESVLIDGGPATDRALEELNQLHADGVRIAIDDFGTGFSALGQLRRLPADVLKIDRTFVGCAHADPRDAKITAALIDLAHALGLQTVAEGVEVPAQLELLRAMGCDLAQGFLLARPMSAPLFAQLAASRARPVPALALPGAVGS